MIRSLPQVLRAARAGKRRPVLVCAAAADAAVLEGVRAATDAGIVDPILIGDSAKMAQLADSLDISLHGLQVVHEPDPVEACRRAVALCRSGAAGALMKGAVPTSVVLKAVLDSEAGLTTGRVLSHVTAFRPRGANSLVLLADAGVNIAPDFECKMQIMRNSIELAQLLGIAKPRVALLAAVETVSGKMPATTEAAAIAGAAKEEFRDLAYVGGPYALDVAVSPAAAMHKGVEDDVAGRADILIAPDIEAGNILYKSLTCFARLDLASLVLGAATPLVIASRADSSRTKLYSIALAMLVAGGKKSP